MEEERKPLKEGLLTKEGARVKNWNLRHFKLFPDRLEYYTPPTFLSWYSMVCNHIPNSKLRSYYLACRASMVPLRLIRNLL